ncbi:MAG: hypothetical protein GY903_01125 [Fuerstiella sp.]|nr:hypothetical protein [Fuerstiella sp.]MCP4853080.1 hypothetical protein [Fuerstiella sp.]
MADMSSTDAFATAPASADKTAILAAFDTLSTALDTANTNGTLDAAGLVQCKKELIDWLEDLGPNMNA